MVGRSRWGGSLFAALVSVGAALGCSQLPIPPYDGGTGSDAPPPMTYGPRALTPLSVDAVALAADDSGIYWTSPANELWVLPTGSPIPVRLASDPGVTASCAEPTAPLLSAAYVLWMGGDRATLHRTRKDGTDDQRLAAVAYGATLAVDGDTVYWTDDSRYPDGTVDGSVIRSLPLDATPGSSPTTLLVSSDAISSLAVSGGIVYWTSYPPDATVYRGTLLGAPAAALAGGGAATILATPGSAYRLTVAGGEIYLGYYADIWTTRLARESPSGALRTFGTLPEGDYVVGLATADGWLLASTYWDGYGCGQTRSLHLWATPLANGTPKLIATGLRTPAVAAPEGIVFVDGARRLVALPADQISRTVSPVP